MSKVYTSNLTLEQWELIEPLIPPAKSGGRPREVEVWDVLNAIFYLLIQGCTWRNLPGDFPAWQTVYRYFRAWRKDGTWLRLHERLRAWVRVASERSVSPSEAIVDSQSVKSAAMVNQAVGGSASEDCWIDNDVMPSPGLLSEVCSLSRSSFESTVLPNPIEVTHD